MIGLERFFGILTKIISLVLIFLFIIMIISLSIQVFGRYLFGAGFVWTDELARWSMIYIVMLGSALLVGDSSHIGIDIIDNLVPRTALKYIAVIRVVLVLIFAAMAVYFSFGPLGVAAKSITANLKISMKYIYLSFPLGYGLMVLYAFYALLKLFVKSGPEEGNMEEGETK